MATKKLSVRLAVEGDAQFKRSLKAAGDQGQRSLQRVEAAGHGASRGLRALNGAAGEVRQGLSGMAGRAGPAGAALSALGAGGLAAAAGLAAVAAATGKGIAVASEFEQAGFKTAAILKATEGASGQTAASIRAMSEEIALATLASVSGVETAAQKLLTFRSISGDTFRRTLEAAQDLAAVGFGSIDSAAVQLGKALEDPAIGLSSLRRIGVSFTEDQQALIKSLAETGRTAEAQRLILTAVEKQVGGAGKAEAGGLAGAYDTLGQRVETFLRHLGNAGPLQGMTSATNALADAVDKLNKALFEMPSVADIERELATLEARLDGMTGSQRQRRGGALRQRIEALREDLQLARGASNDPKQVQVAIAALDRQIAEAKQRVDDLPDAGQATTGRRRHRSRGAREVAAANAELAELIEQREALYARLTALEQGDKPPPATAPQRKPLSEIDDPTQAMDPQRFQQLRYLELDLAQGPAPADPRQAELDAQHQARLEKLRESFLSERDLETSHYEERRAWLEGLHTQFFESEAERKQLLQNLEREHQGKLTDIERTEQDKRQQLREAAARAALSHAQQSLSITTDAMRQAGQEHTGVYKALFAVQKAAAIPSMIVSAEEASTKALAAYPPPAGPILANAVRAMGYASIGIVAGQAVAGIAHGGLDNVPKEQTYLLDRGERVLSPRQNVEVTRAAERINSGAAGAQVTVNLIEDASRAGQQRQSGLDGRQVIDVFVANIRARGEAAQAIETYYQGMERRGR